MRELDSADVVFGVSAVLNGVVPDQGPVR